MMKRRRPTTEDTLPGEDEISRMYAATARDLPSPALDKAILAIAHAAVAENANARRTSSKRWLLALSTAAVLVLSVSVVVQLIEQDAETTTFERRRDEPAAAPPSVRERVDTRTASKSLSPLTAPAAPPPVADIPKREAAAALAKEADRTADLAPVQEGNRRRKAQSADTNAAAPLLEHRLAARDTADVISVSVRGEPDAYEFLVGVRSPNRGCARYADWWEVLSEDGRLLYRRLLTHERIDNQVFVDAGGPVRIMSDTVVWVRAHMSDNGYGGVGFKGSVAMGFRIVTLPKDFAPGLAKQPPQPEKCRE